jgi:hypothetical protein
LSAFALRLREEIKRPLAETDVLPVLVNVADRKFEATGAIDALTVAIRQILQEQPEGKPVDARLIEAAIVPKTITLFNRAYEESCEVFEGGLGI